MASANHEVLPLFVGAPEPVFGSSAPAPTPPTGDVAIAAAFVGATVLVDAGVFVLVGAAVFVAVGVAVQVGVAVDVLVNVAVAVDVVVAVDVDVGVLVHVAVGVGVLVAVGVSVGVLVHVAVAVDVGVDVAVDVAVRVAVGVSVGQANATPPPPGNIRRAAMASDSATERLMHFVMSRDPPDSGRPRTRVVIASN